MNEVLPIIAIILGAAIVFPAFWSAVVWLIGFNWRGLAREYPAGTWPDDGYKVSWQSAALGMANYSSVLNFVAAEDGLYIRPLWMYRAGHPPVFIPWEEVEAVEPSALFGKRLVLANGRSITVRSRLGEAIQAAIDAHDAGLADAVSGSTIGTEAETENGGSSEGTAARVRARSR